MKHSHFFFRFLIRLALSLTIFLSTLPLSTWARPLASSLNFRHPLGFFFAFLAMLFSLCLANPHEAGIVSAGQNAISRAYLDYSVFNFIHASIPIAVVILFCIAQAVF